MKNNEKAVITDDKIKRAEELQACAEAIEWLAMKPRTYGELLRYHPDWFGWANKRDLVPREFAGINLAGLCIPQLTEFVSWLDWHELVLARANLQEADLSFVNLIGADLSGANLRRARLRATALHKADLKGADLQGAQLRSAGLGKADLRGANLKGADLSRANLQMADFRGANLKGATLRHAMLWGSIFENANLKGIKL